MKMWDTDENVGIDTKTKSVDGLIWKIFVISPNQHDNYVNYENSIDKKLFEILTVENVGTDTKTMYLESLIWNIFVIE